ncbi:MAG: hypothetical protein AB1422_00585 [bacterium]
MCRLNISKERFTVLCAAAILFFSCSVPSSAQGDQIRILVAPEFKNISGVKEVEQWAIPDLLTTAFKKYGGDRIEIIERESIPEILDVIAFNEEMKGIIDSKTIIELKGLGANFYATGKITKLNKQIIVIVRLINMIELTIRTSKIITFEEQDKNIPEKIDCLGSQLFSEILPPLSPLIWEIGKDDNSFGEFNQLPKFPGPFPWHYNGGDPPDEFPKEINDGERTPIYIHYSLTEEQADKDLALILDTCGGAGDDFSIRVITLANGEKPQSLGVYKFSTSKSILDKEKTHEIKIDNAKTKSGTNTLILENASPPNSGRWLFWDYLSLKVIEEEEVSIKIDEIVPDSYIRGRVFGLDKSQYSQYKVVVYVKTDKWYIHPYADGGEGFTFAKIKGDGSWEIQTVKRPWPAREVATFIVKRDYSAPATCYTIEEIKCIARYIEDGGGRL